MTGSRRPLPGGRQAASAGGALAALARLVRTQAMALRFVAVGVANTVFGYSIILTMLALGAGDYLANASGYAGGLVLSYFLHRNFTFAVGRRASLREAGRFAGAALAAYAVNLGVLATARSMGQVENPLVHALAMVSYSATFFLLNRFLVFAARGRREAGSARFRWADRYPEAVLAGIAALTWWSMLNVRIEADVVWQYWIARQLIGGTRLYADIWEVNPPLWFWSAVPIEWLAERTGVAWSTLLITLDVGLGLVAAGLVAHLLELPRRQDRLAVMLLVFVMAVVLPIAHLGQREQLALVTGLPYAALIARRHAGRAVPAALAIAVATLAAYGFALKHYFALAPLALELWLALRLRRGWRPWRPELVVLAALALAYAASVLVFAPEFLTVMVPIVRATYYTFEPSTLFMVVKPYVLFWAVAGLFLWLTRDEPLAEAPPVVARLFPATLVMAAGFALGYALQWKGWDYHSVPATAAMAVAVGLRIARFRRWLPAAIGAALLAALVFAMYPVSYRPAPADPDLDRVPAGEPVFVASLYASGAWSQDRSDLRWVSRAYSLWMLQAVAKAELVGPETPALRRLSAQVLRATSDDIRCNPPYVIQIQEMPPIVSRPGEFSFRDFLFRDPALRRFVAEHYTARPATPLGTAYWRNGPVSRVAGLSCRTVR